MNVYEPMRLETFKFRHGNEHSSIVQTREFIQGFNSVESGKLVTIKIPINTSEILRRHLLPDLLYNIRDIV